MKVIELINVIKAIVPFTYYPNMFPATAADDVAIVRLTGGGAPNVNVGRPSFQVMVRAKSPATAEVKALEVFNQLNQKRNFDVGTTHVIFCSSQQSTPLFIGTDDNGRSIYSVNFIMITEAN